MPQIETTSVSVPVYLRNTVSEWCGPDEAFHNITHFFALAGKEKIKRIHDYEKQKKLKEEAARRKIVEWAMQKVVADLPADLTELTDFSCRMMEVIANMDKDTMDEVVNSA